MECRLCLHFKSAESSISIYTSESLVERIQNCCRLQVEKYNELPGKICQTCASNLQMFYDFKNICRRNDKLSRVRMTESLNLKTEEILHNGLYWENDPERLYTSTSTDENSSKKLGLSMIKQEISQNSNSDKLELKCGAFSKFSESTQNGISINMSKENAIKIEEVMLADLDWENEPACVEKTLCMNKKFISSKQLELNVIKQGISDSSNFKIQMEIFRKFSTENESTQNNMISNESFGIKKSSNTLMCIDENSTNDLELNIEISHGSNLSMQKEHVCLPLASSKSIHNNDISKSKSMKNFVIKPNENFGDSIWESEPVCIKKSLCTDKDNPNNTEVITTKQIVDHIFNQEQDEDSDIFHELSDFGEFDEFSESDELIHNTIKKKLPIRSNLELVTAKQVLSESMNTEVERLNATEIMMPNESTQNIGESYSTEVKRVHISEIAMLNELPQNIIKDSSGKEIERVNTGEIVKLNEWAQNNIEENPSTELERLNTSEIAMVNESTQNNTKESSSTKVEKVSTSEIAMLKVSTQNIIEENSYEVERVCTGEIAISNESTQNRIDDSSPNRNYVFGHSSSMEIDGVISNEGENTISNESTKNDSPKSTVEFKYSTTVKGKQLLIYSSFEYIYLRTTNGVTTWRCRRHRDLRCHSTMKTKNDTIACHPSAHCHDSCLQYMEANIVQRKMLEAMDAVGANSHNVIESILSQVSNEVLAYLPKKTSMMRNLQRYKIKKLGIQNNNEKSSTTEVERVNTSEIATLNASTKSDSPKSTMEIKYSTTKKGKQLLICSGFEYIYLRASNGVTTWRCRRYRDLRCYSRMKTKNDVIICHPSSHCHDSCLHYMEANIVQRKMFEAMDAVGANSHNVMESVLSQVSNEVLPYLPKKASMVRNLQRYKVKKLGIQNNNESSSSTEVEEENTSEFAMLNESTQNIIEKKNIVEESSYTEVERVSTNDIAIINESTQNRIEDSTSNRNYVFSHSSSMEMDVINSNEGENTMPKESTKSDSPKSAMEFKYSTTEQGKQILIYSGFEYLYFRTTNGVTTWRCRRNRSLRCHSSMKIKNDVIVCHPSAHCHDSCPQDIEANIAKRKMIQAMGEVGANSRNAMESVLSQVSNEVLAYLPKKSSISRNLLLHKKRNKNEKK